tara:strand:+ start:4481 stop:5476 length:996 start_codon:yes stop_codon:yes gene_type:complete
MNKFITIFSILLISTVGSLAANFEFSTGNPDMFKVKPISMQLCEDWNRSTGECSGDNTYTIVKTMTADDGRCDIAGATQNAIACTFGSFKTPVLPSGVTYPYIRVELSRTMWLRGTVTNTNSPSSTGLSVCHTDGSNTQASNSENAEGNVTVDFTPTLQQLTFVNGAGNEATIAAGVDNGTKTTANTNSSAYGQFCTNDASNQACSWNTLPSLVAQGAQHFIGESNGSQTSGVGTPIWNNKDYYMQAGYYASTEHIWMSDVEEADTSMILMYVLAAPYTTKAGITPTLKMSFSVSEALDADFFKSEVGGQDDVLGCTVYVGSPGVTMLLYD